MTSRSAMEPALTPSASVVFVVLVVHWAADARLPKLAARVRKCPKPAYEVDR